MRTHAADRLRGLLFVFVVFMAKGLTYLQLESIKFNRT